VNSEQPKINKPINQHVRVVLQKTIHNLLSDIDDSESLIARHVWRDSNYVGVHAGKVVAWRGWRAKLDTVDGRYRTLYIDLVDNALPPTERQRLFGEPFSRAVAGLPRFVVLFTLGFPLHAENDIIAHGFVPRRLSRVLHACLPLDVNAFLAAPARQWAERAVRLLELQSRWGVSQVPGTSESAWHLGKQFGKSDVRLSWGILIYCQRS
jgi:hypothetical protein